MSAVNANFVRLKKFPKFSDYKRTTRKQFLELQKKSAEPKNKCNLSDAFQNMMSVTKKIDDENKRKSDEMLANAFQKMITLSAQIDQKNQQIKEQARLEYEERTKVCDNKVANRVLKKAPAKYRRLPKVFKKNPKLVIKYFAGIILGRTLAIVIYIIAMLIPALPIPEGIVAWVGKPLRAIGGMFVSLRATTIDLDLIIRLLTTIPTDINKLLQKLGELISYYGKQFIRFVVLVFQHPKLALQKLLSYCRSHGNLMFRIGRGTLMLIFSLLLIKAAMVFFLPMLGGIALTVVGVKVSLLIFFVVRMISDQFGKFLGKKLYRFSYRTYVFIRSHLPGWKEEANKIPQEGVRLQHRTLNRHEKAKLAVQNGMCVDEVIFRQRSEARRKQRIKEHAKRTSVRLAVRAENGKWQLDKKQTDEYLKKVM